VVSRSGLRERLRYRFDNTMSKGAPALIGLLGIASAVLVVVFGVFGYLARPMPEGKDWGIGKTLWMALLHAMDPGTVTGDDGPAFWIFLMFAVTIGGIFVVAALVGVITTGLEAKLDDLRKGRSHVVEAGHTVLLGWSEQLFTVIAELAVAKESERRPCVAILADRDKVEMEDEIRARLGSLGKLRVVCRTGSPTEPADLDLVNPPAAASVLVLTPEVDDPDASVIKTLLALTSRDWRGNPPHVVAAIRLEQNLPPARLAGGEHATVVDVDDLAARLVVQSSRQSGLSVVCTDLLDFGGDEIYLRPEPALTGAPFGVALFAYDTATLVGLRRRGHVVLNPRADTRIEPGDELILIAEDDSMIRLAHAPLRPGAPQMIVRPVRRTIRAERVLVIGWNARGVKIVKELDNYVAPGSRLQVAAAQPDAESRVKALAAELSNLHTAYQLCEPTDRGSLETLGIGEFDRVIVLADDSVELEQADSQTLVTLLHLRDMESRRNERYSIVSEMNDERNQRLAQVTKADDFVVGSKLISLLLTQLSENRHLSVVFQQLFEAEGSEIYLRPAEEYVALSQWIDFATLIEAARMRGETAIGYRVMADAHQAPSYGVRLNPVKTTPFAMTPGDRVIVLAED
jgi:voltage-gated potassium channel Kch